MPEVFCMDSENEGGTPDRRTVSATEGMDGSNEMSKMTLHNPPRNKYRVMASCLWTFSCGYSDAAPGTLLPFIEKYYGLNYTLVSLIWMANAVGFLLVASLASKIQPILGKQYSLMVGCCLSIVHFSMVSGGPHFAVVVLGYFFGGAGLGICLAQTNVFLASLDKSTLYLSFNHASYGLGATISPLLATLLVTHGVEWHLAYLINLGLMVINLVLVGLAFRGAREDLKPWEPESKEEDNTNSRNSSTMKEATSNHLTWIFAFFIMFYQGSEVALAGWCVTYLIQYKNGNIDQIGYVASAFWAGLTLGRLLLTHPSVKYIGARRSLIIMCVITIIAVVLAWVLPDTISSSAFVAFAGVWIGPLYSLVVGTTVKPGMLPRKIQVTSLTIVTAFGSAGGAIFPFLIGVLSDPAGSYVVFPVFLALYVAMMALWFCLPNVERINGAKKPTFWQRVW